jgi:hypothetical protein
MSLTKRFRVEREREFKPHHILIGAAKIALESAEQRTPGWIYYELTAITFSALALEALTNSFGKRLVKRWDDFESASPTAKLRVICSRLRVEPDFQNEPWSVIPWLVKFRNKIAHAKPESIKYDKTMTEEEFQKLRLEYPHSKLEMQINLKNAKRSIDAIDQILDLFYPKLNADEKYHLYSSGFSGSTSVC